MQPVHRRIRFSATIAILAVVITVGCASIGGSGTSSESGVVGTTVVDAGCPNTPSRNPCADRPIRARLSLTDERSGAEVGMAESAPDGSFHINAAPGHYLLHATGWTSAPLPAAPPPLPVEVRTGHVTPVLVRFDSGVR
jgi:hypothetical protein